MYKKIERSHRQGFAEMKTWCVAVLLSFVSVCSAAPLTCEKLLTQRAPDPVLTGRWYLQALSTDSCVVSSLLNTLLNPSLAVDVTLKETPNTYDASYTIKMFGYCINSSDSFSYENGVLSDLDKNNRTTASQYHLLTSSCSDCLVFKDNTGLYKSLGLYSRQKTVSSEDLREFETQASCHNLPSPRVFDTDYDFANCKSPDDYEADEAGLTILKVSAAELQMFETMAACLSSSSPCDRHRLC